MKASGNVQCGIDMEIDFAPDIITIRVQRKDDGSRKVVSTETINLTRHQASSLRYSLSRLMRMLDS